MIVQRNKPGWRYTQLRKELRTVSGVLCRYNVDRAQCRHGTRGNITDIPDRRRDNVKHTTRNRMIVHMQTPGFLLRLCITLLLVLHSTGCQSGSAGSEKAVADPVMRADALLLDMPRGNEARQQRLLTAAMLYANSKAYAKATETLNQIDTTQLDRNLRGDFLVTAADAALGSGDVDGALATLTRPPAGRYGFIDSLSPLDHARVAERRALVLERRGQFSDAIRERVLAASSLPANTRRSNDDALWAALLRIDRAGLKQLEAQSDPVLNGWAALATAWRDGADSPLLRANRIEAWVTAHATHPAAGNLPPAVIQARSRAAEIPTGPATIAVILPQHGKLSAAGTAIQRGILAAWYQARENNLPAPSLQFFDSSRSDFLATYDAAVESGAQLIIGPLEKENLRLLQQRGKLPVATLALNYPDADTTQTSGLFYFGLAGEDEAIQIAVSAARGGLRRAAILYPDADWGQRIAKQFEQTLQEQGGRVQARSSYQSSGDYSDVVRRLLDAGASEQRHARLERLLGAKLAFQPRRRQDIDFLFFIANTAQAIQLAPSVQYHYGNGLVTLATSHVNSQANANSSGDLDGIRFLEMPWLIDNESPLRVSVASTWQDVDERYMRLYALGIDALRVSQQLTVLRAGNGPQIEGATGLLSMDAANKVHRQLSWMIFHERQSARADALE